MRLNDLPSLLDHSCVLVTTQEGPWDSYNLVPFDNVDRGCRLTGVPFEGLAAFDAFSRGCLATFPSGLDVFQLALHGHIYLSSCRVA